MIINIRKLFEYILAICIVLNCESIWCWKEHSGYFKIALFIISVVSLLYLIGNKSKKSRIKKNEFNKLCILMIYISIFIILNLSNSLVNLIQLAIICILLFIYCNDEKTIEEIIEKISNIMILLGVVSILFFLLGNVFNILKPNGNIIIFVNDNQKVCDSYFNLHFNVQKEEIFSNELYRNTGIFYESPKYSLLLVLSLIYEVFYREKYSLKKILILSLTIISTMSMTGIYADIVILLSFIVFKYNKKKIAGNFVRIFVIIILFAIGPSLLGKIETIFDKKTNTASYETRIDNYVAGYKAWLENPVFGTGFMNMDKIKENYSRFRMNDLGYSNSIFRILAQGGLYLMFIYAYPVIRNIIKGIREKNINNVLGCLMFGYLFITTSFSYNYIIIIWLLFFYRLSIDKKGEINDKETKDYI